MDSRGWRQADLARKSDLHRAIISKLVLGKSTPQTNTLLAIASALNLPPMQLFEAAGILPPKVIADPWVEKMSHRLASFDPVKRQALERFVEAMKDEE